MRLRLIASAVTLAVSLPVVPLLASPASADDPLAAPLTAAGSCDALDPRACLLPFPTDTFTPPDDSTPTGRRVDLSLWELVTQGRRQGVEEHRIIFNDEDTSRLHGVSHNSHNKDVDDRCPRFVRQMCRDIKASGDGAESRATR